MKVKKKDEIRYADLFGGVGGFRLGIERATNVGFIQQENKERMSNSNGTTPQHNKSVRTKCVFYNDFDKYAVQTYNKNFKENYEATDIRTIKTNSIPDFDMLCGGFPCQAFSIAGKRKGFGDTRGTLFFEIERIIRDKRPRLVFLENVKGLLNHDKGRTFTTILHSLWKLGYDVQWMVLNSKFFGVPQNRERVFIIGSLRGTSKPEILPFKESDKEDNGSFTREKEISPTRQDLQSEKRYPKSSSRNSWLNPPLNENRSQGQAGGQGAKTGLYGVNQIGTRKDSNSGTQPFQQDRVYDSKGISPALQQGLPEGSHKVTIIRGRPKMPYEHGKRELNYTTYKDTCPTLSENCASGDQKNMVVKAVLTPDRENKRQNGRRFKEDGEPMFTLTEQDKHGVLFQPAQLVNKNRAKKPYNPNDREMKIKVRDDKTSYTVKSATHEFMVAVMKNKDIEKAIKKGYLEEEDVGKDFEFNSNKMSIRRLTPTECERLQGFPDNWTEGVSDTQRYKQMGNAVTVNVIQAIAERLMVTPEVVVR